MSAIPCASVSMKTMADGTLRISFDIEPNHAQDAFRLFASPGTPAAIAALQVGYASVGDKPSPVEEKPKGGALSKLAGVWCNDWEFVKWIIATVDKDVTNFAQATAFVRRVCQVSSRAELDHEEAAAERFNRLIRGPYMKYMLSRGGNGS